MILETLNYGAAVAIVSSYALAYVVAFCTLQPGVTSNSFLRRRVYLCTLSFATTVCYLVQSVHGLLHASIVSDDVLVGALSKFLLWITMSLIFFNTVAPVLFIYTGVWLLASLVDLTILISTLRNRESLNDYDIGRFVLQSFTCTMLVVLVATAFFISAECKSVGDGEETKSLLGKQSSNSSTSCLSGLTYNSVDDENNHSGSEFDSGSDSDEDEEGEKDLKAAQNHRLEETGGWVGYIEEFKVFIPYVFPSKDFKLQFYIACLLINTLAQRALNVLHPRQLGIIVTQLTITHQVPLRDILLWVLFAVLASESCGIGAINELIQNRLAIWSHQRLTIAAFDHVMGLSMTFHDQKDSGEIIKAVEQASSMNTLLRAVVLDILPGLLDILIAIWYIAYLLDVYAMLIVIAVGIIFSFATYYMTQVIAASRRISSARDRDESKLLYESVGNWSIISYFNRKAYEMSRLSGAVNKAARANLWNEDAYTYIFGLQELAEHLGRLAISILAAYRVVSGLSPVGSFITFEGYWSTITMPLYILGHSYRRLSSDLIDAERLLQLFQTRPTVVDKPTAKAIDLQSGFVEFDDVQFAYEGHESILTNFNLRAEPGQTIALVGETGSGKSTILKLLMRFYDIESGRITIDNQDIRDVTIDSLRDLFGFVPQDSVLFNMSIMENVRYGRLNASNEEVYEACRAASIHDKILSFPHGYASKVGERGIKLSGGERQRVAIARVFLKNPKIVLLDEATSAMDSHTEAKIQEALQRLIKGRTAFVIAHRLSTVMNADKILVIDKGSVIESGTHRELSQRKGSYFNLWSKQSALDITLD